MKTLKKQPKTPDESEFACTFCKKKFKAEKSLLIHMCEPKNRVLSRSQPHVRFGMQAYQRFWKKCQNPKHTPTWEDFEKSSLYLAFVRFGRHISNLCAINPLGYVDFLLRAEVGIDDWCRESHYYTFVREMNKLETPLQALERNYDLMQSWAIQEKENWFDFFRKIAPPLAVLWIKSGKISPWVLLTAPSASDLFDRFDKGQIEILNESIDEKFWEIKIDMHKADVEEIKKVLKEAGV